MENLKQPCLTGWLTGFNSPRVVVSVCLSVRAVLAWRAGVCLDQEGENKNKKIKVKEK